MKSRYPHLMTLCFICIVFSLSGFSQQPENLWTVTTKKKADAEQLISRKTHPLNSSFYRLDIESLKSVLQSVPQRESLNGLSNTILDFPTSYGTMESFRVMEASIMHPTLQAEHPDIQSYVAQGVSDPSKLMRFSVTPKGFHAMILSSNGAEFIDPYTDNNDFYIVYSKKDLPTLDDPFLCLVMDMETERNQDLSTARNANDGMLRNYDLALACTVEYSAYHVNAAGLNAGTLAQKKAAVLAAMNVTMTRVNGIFERDLSLTMTLVPNNQNIIFIDSDSFNNNDANVLINQSQTVIDNFIGSPNYDIGHTFSTGGGGLAQPNSPCVNGNKARGITGLATPIGDPYDIDFVAHEMGHQFGGFHTFNGSAGNCAGGNRSANDAYEPGSGTTIMAYAGICSPQNVQNNSDAYFHQRSLVTIWNNISGGPSSTCPTMTNTGNFAPTAEAGGNFTIPKSTPYRLTASSTDGDGIGTHTYTWEQYDLGPAGLPTETTASGPLVRSFEGTSDPVRYVPRLQDLLQNYGSTEWEKLSSVARPINFRVTVRDNDNRGGQTAADNMTATVSGTAGPFIVTSQTEDQLVWTPSTSETVTWNVAGTTANGINTNNVDILLSTDGGFTYDTVLVSNTPNDGSETITVPNLSAPYCRVMVAPVGNIYFSINTKDFAVGNYTYQLGDVCEDYLFNANIPVPVNSTSYAGFILTVDDSFTLSDCDVSVQFTHPNVGNLFYAVRAPFQGNTDIIRLASGACPGATDVNLTFDDEGNAINCGNTTSGESVIPQDPLSVVDGQNSAGDWIFFMTDITDDGVSGTWNSTTLTLCREELIPVLSNDEFTIENSFAIYPNPNNGEFNVKLKSFSNQDIEIEVYDIRGRSVFVNSYENTTDFNQTISLTNLQSGMYLVKVSDGKNESTKKIIIN